MVLFWKFEFTLKRTTNSCVLFFCYLQEDKSEVQRRVTPHATSPKRAAWAASPNSSRKEVELSPPSPQKRDPHDYRQYSEPSKPWQSQDEEILDMRGTSNVSNSRKLFEYGADARNGQRVASPSERYGERPEPSGSGWDRGWKGGQRQPTVQRLKAEKDVPEEAGQELVGDHWLLCSDLETLSLRITAITRCWMPYVECYMLLLLQPYVEKNVRICQKPNNPKGFGFTIRGGKEHGTPIMVEKVILG